MGEWVIVLDDEQRKRMDEALLLSAASPVTDLMELVDNATPASHREELTNLLRELYEYVCKIEGGYMAQAAVRGYMQKPDQLHPGIGDVGARVRAVLGVDDPEEATHGPS